MAQNIRVVGVRELKAHASAILREVSEGSEVIISVRGRPIARIEPLPGDGTRSGVDGMGNSRGAFSNLPHLEWEDFVAAKTMWKSEPVDGG